MVSALVVLINQPNRLSVRLLKIYTKTGDKGETGLIGGQRTSKADPRIIAYGAVDELNSHIGAAIASLSQLGSVFSDVTSALVEIQNNLFVVGSDLANPDPLSGKGVDGPAASPRTSSQITTNLENKIDAFESELEPITFFILPGGSAPAASLHICRSIARRAETCAVQLSNGQKINPEVVVYLNRLSDFMFVAARIANKRLGVKDVAWRK